MPEGPEVRTLVDQLRPAVGMRLLDLEFLSGRYVKHGPPKGRDVFARTMTPFDESAPTTTTNERIDTVSSWNAKGKFIWIVLDDDADRDDDDRDDDRLRSIWITLGMSGRFSNDSDPTVASRARWVMRFRSLDDGTVRSVYYEDQRNFGTLRFCLSAAELADKLASLGPDILADETDVGDFLAAMEKQNEKTNVCKFLMNQKRLSGVGNYLLAEGLYRADVDPFASLAELDRSQRVTLFRELRATARESYAAQGVTRRSGGSYRTVDGEKGGFELRCYGRESCPKGNRVHRETNGPHGRTIWYTAEQLFVPRSARAEDGTIATIATTTTTTSSELDHLTDESWRRALSHVTSSASFVDLMDFVRLERAASDVYPPPADTFAALNACPLDDVRVVVVGQDPYHGPGQGHGLAFSVRDGVAPPPSLRNVLRELRDDVGVVARGGNLERWAARGVLLLNAVLTVRRGEPNSHSKAKTKTNTKKRNGVGWEEFTDAVVEAVVAKEKTVVFLLWGAPAAKKAAGVDETRHVVIRTSHPSPLGATKTASPFLGSRCFSRVNEALVASGQEPVNWDLGD